MVKQVETEKNNSESNNNNNNNASHDDLNSIFKNRKIVRIKRSVIFRDSIRKNESISEDNNAKKMTTKIVVVHRSTHDAIVGGSGDNYEQQQFVRLVSWIQKRKAVDDVHEEGQEEFSHYRNKRKRIKYNDSDNTAMRAGCTFTHKPDYDFIISWF